MEIKILANFRPSGKEITLNNDKTVSVMAIRRGPRGVVAMVINVGPIILWDDNVADEHLNDSEEVLLQRLIDILNT